MDAICGVQCSKPQAKYSGKRRNFTAAEDTLEGCTNCLQHRRHFVQPWRVPSAAVTPQGLARMLYLERALMANSLTVGFST